MLDKRNKHLRFCGSTGR